MKRCPNCNRAYSDVVKVCSACGTDLSGNATPVRPQAPQNYAAKERPQETRVVEGQVIKPVVHSDSANDSGSIGWGVLGFAFPIVGWILHHTWKDKKPNNAKVANTGAWIGFAVGILMTLAGA